MDLAVDPVGEGGRGGWGWHLKHSIPDYRVVEKQTWDAYYQTCLSQAVVAAAATVACRSAGATHC